MTGPSEADPQLTPEEAFEVVGHETRVEILRVLATTDRADRPLRFSEINDRVGDIDSAHFNYHLDKLTDHFLARREDGYDFRRPGRRVAQAIRSGAVTGNCLSGVTPVEQDCHHCGASLSVVYHDERIAIYCPDCPGTYARDHYRNHHPDVPEAYGFLGLHDLPPAGMADRTPTAALERAHRWSLLDTLSTVEGLCPRCSAAFDERVDVCPDHEGTDEVCARCGYRHAAVYTAACRNCTFDKRLPFGTTLAGTTELVAFLSARGFDPLSAGYERFSTVFKNYGESVLGTDPFEARFTYSLDGEEISLTVDADRTVRSTSR